LDNLIIVDLPKALQWYNQTVTDDLLALSSLDGRYARETAQLREYFSEFAFIRNRAILEIKYLLFLSQDLQIIRIFSAEELEFLSRLAYDFSIDDALQTKKLEQATRHDVKAITDFLNVQLSQSSLSDITAWIHFGLTSEDVNLTALAVALRAARDQIILPELKSIISELKSIALQHKSTPMLARTHGQPAVPTTFGKEIAVFCSRLTRQKSKLETHKFESKWSGAVGNLNAFEVGAPGIDWIVSSESFLKSLGLEPTPISTQIIPYDNWLEYFQTIHLINSILIDLSHDFWRYISDNFLKLRVVANEVGSSTMPQKVNPIDFENAEGNLGLANSIFEQFIRKLPVSRLQRDLSDSTVRRSFGTAMGYTLVAWKSVLRGLNRVEVDEATMRSNLEQHYEVVAEGAQTILRSTGNPSAYNLLKILTRGQGITAEKYRNWVEDLEESEDIKKRLLAISPTTYLGKAELITENIIKEI